MVSSQCVSLTKYIVHQPHTLNGLAHSCFQSCRRHCFFLQKGSDVPECHQCPLPVLPQALTLSLVVTSAPCRTFSRMWPISGHTTSVQQCKHGSEFWSGIQDRDGGRDILKFCRCEHNSRPRVSGSAQPLAGPLESFSSAGIQAQEGTVLG